MSPIRFDQALPALVRHCEGHSTFQSGEVVKACVVRDLRGRIRLVIKPAEGYSPDLQALEKTLDANLGGYFYGPILSVGAPKRDEVRLAAKLLELSRPWRAEYQDPFTGQDRHPPEGRWLKLEKRLAKQAWLDETRPGRPPWELGDGRPAIVTFYSFKGGVGRTTALVSCAWQLARAGKRVAVLDLDLEGPGAGALLDAGSEHGVIDFLVDHLATENRELNGLTSTARALGELAENVGVLAAGTLDLEYLEKLGRLDFQSSLAGEEDSPAERALEALLHAVHKELRPDFVFLDARSGLHNLSGLSLHGLAHVDVLFTRASPQGYAGLDLTVQALARRRAQADLLAIVVHAFAPTDPSSEVYERETQEILERSYESFCEHVYEDDAPAIEARDAPHYPRPLRANPALERFAHLSGVSSYLLADDYQALLDRIVELCEPQDEQSLDGDQE